MNGSCLHTWDTDRYIDVVCNYENSLIAYYTGSEIAVLDIETKQVVTKLEETGKVRSITMSQDGKYILANSNDKNDNTKARINLWNIESAKVVQTYVGHIQEKYVLK
jgi:tricorn protease-like protein